MAIAEQAGIGGGAPMNDEVFYDWGKIRTAASDLSGVLDTFKENIETIYGDVKALNSFWSGPSYDAFKANCESYKTSTIEPLITKINDWVNKMEELAAQAESTSQKNTGLFETK